MKRIRMLSLVGLGALCFFVADSGSYGQRLGGGARAAVGGARAGAAAGPYGGAGAGLRTSQTVIGPGGGAATAGAARGSYTTGRGTTIDYAGAGRAATGPGGATAGRGVGGVQVTTPGGQQFTKLGGVQGAVGPNGNGVIQKGSIGLATGPNGAAVAANRGGLAIGPSSAVAGGTRVGAAVGPGAAVVGGARGGVAVGSASLGGYTARAAVGHRTAYVAAGTLRTRGVYVRQNFVHYNCFHPAWYTAHPRAWRPAAWTAAAFWRGVAWATLVSSCGYPPQPVVYDYGSTVVYQGDTVYYGGDPVATAAEYADQAAAIADQGQQAQPTEKDAWIPLGVFGMVKGEETDSNQIFQLAINKDGVLRGNYYDGLSDTTLPVFGAVDRRTQRAAWTVGDRKETVYETGVGNLTEPETTMLVHFGKDRTQQWTLIRLQEQADQP